MNPIPRVRSALAARALGLLAAGLVTTAPAFAGFLGHDVTADYHFPSLNSTYVASGTATVGAAVEFTDIGGTGQTLTNADFSDTNILLTYTAGWGLSGRGVFDGYVFSDLTASDIIGVSLAGTNLAGLTDAHLTFNGSQVFLNTLGLGSWGPNTFVSIDVQFADPVSDVPEPGALALSGLALLVLVSTRRPRRPAREWLDAVIDERRQAA